MTPAVTPGLLRRSVAVLALASLVFAATSASAMAALQQTLATSYQTNGTVHSIVRSDGVVYIGGAFTSVRPAGSALGVNETARNHLAAFTPLRPGRCCHGIPMPT